MKPEQPADTVILPADAYVGISLLASATGEIFFPLALLPGAVLFGPLTLTGLALAVCGFVLEVAAARALARAGSSTSPNGAATALVTGSVFRRSRNPFYLGILLVVAGIMLAFSLDCGAVFLPLLWLGVDRWVAPVEECRLERAFGQEFHNYAATTRRWL